MFKNNKETSPAKKQTTQAPSGDHTIIGSSAAIKGDLECQGDLRLDGQIEGNVLAKNRLVVGKSGVLKGNIDCKSGEIQGKVTGDIKCSGVFSIRPNGTVEGSISAGQLIMEDGATLNSTSVITLKGGSGSELKK